MHSNISEAIKDSKPLKSKAHSQFAFPNAKNTSEYVHLRFPIGWLAQKPVFSADIEQESIYLNELGLILNYD